MVFGETPRANKHNADRRLFRLWGEGVRERLSYDHVGVTACSYEDEVSGILGRLSKARRALNAISGLGICKNGLSLHTCCIIFWAIIVPIALFGCEMTVLLRPWILFKRTKERESRGCLVGLRISLSPDYSTRSMFCCRQSRQRGK